MTQHVFTNSMVAHVWAQQTQDSGRSNNGQFYFEGRTLYSYGTHYVAGYALPRPNGALIHIANADSYSITTARHVSLARYAVPGYVHSVESLTELARILDSGLNVWEYPKDSIGRTCPTPRRATMAERRATLPALRRFFVGLDSLPMAGTIEAILAAMGNRDAAATARRIAREHKARIDAAEAARIKRAQRDAQSVARRVAACSPQELDSRIDSLVAESYGPNDAAKRLNKESHRVLGAMREARRMGWTQMVATLRNRRRQIRQAAADCVARYEKATRNANKRRAIQAYRNALHHVGQITGGGMDHNAQARAFAGLAKAGRDLQRAVVLPFAAVGKVARAIQLAEAAREVSERAANAARHAAEAEAREAWLNGENPRGFYRLSDETGAALIRAEDVERDDSGQITGGKLRTSHGATVPLVHALRVYQFLKLCRATGRDWTRNGRGLRVGHFAVDSVAPSGDFVAGCHRFKWAEVSRLAGVLGVASMAAEDTTAPA